MFSPNVVVFIKKNWAVGAIFWRNLKMRYEVQTTIRYTTMERSVQGLMLDSTQREGDIFDPMRFVTRPSLNSLTDFEQYFKLVPC